MVCGETGLKSAADETKISNLPSVNKHINVILFNEIMFKRQCSVLQI